jgi:hypothetical protein
MTHLEPTVGVALNMKMYGNVTLAQYELAALS